ncbi:sugar kinase [Mycobacterium sp. URHB0021]
MVSTSASATPHITCIGEALIVLSAQHGPLETAATFTRGAAGAEVNVATTLAALGMATSVITRVGDDGFGRYLTAHLAEAGVDTTSIVVDPIRPTGLYIKERGGGSAHPNDLPVAESRMRYYRRDSAGAALAVDDLNRPPVARVLRHTNLIHISGITPALSDTSRRLVTQLMHGGRRCSFDLNHRPALWPDTQSAADTLADCVRSSSIVLMGLDEAAAVFGTASPGRIRNEFPEPEYLVVKNDAHHVIGFHRNVAVEVPSLTVDVVEKIGAGDAFAGGFLAGVITGKDMEHALRMGHICAASTLSTVGDAAAPPPTELTRLLGLDKEQWRSAQFTQPLIR